MNGSLKRRLHATIDLRDFYNIFCDVTSKENGEDHRCNKGTTEMVFPSINILKQAVSVYTIEALLMFEKEFIDGASYNYKEVDSSKSNRSFEMKEPMVSSSVWKIQMMRKINSLITASQTNMNARVHCEKYFMELKKLIKFDVSSTHYEEDGHGKNINSSQNVLNPHGSHQKGVRNKTFKSIIENKCNQVKRRKTKKLSMNDVASSTSTLQIVFLHQFC
ncbi:hypothetical protein Cgig2_032090 [Carnegiea gigantea]|uniref:Uncharacterized protein n=1 Tax=Carnegiea gigantea TaxID=171969 RepID=A0A9Q1JS01_9CARY|nr:hypothetical protein Cgig2_032090 [Carnegiea gigantea]